MKKFLIYLLVGIMLLSTLSVLVGCEEEESPVIDNEDDDEVVADDYGFPDIERKDYSDEFNFYVGPSNGGVRLWYMDSDLNRGSAMDEAVYQRQERVRRYLGVEFVNVTYPDVYYNTYHTNIQSAVQNMDGTVDALVTHVHGSVSNLISENLIMDFNELQGIDLDKEYWHKDFMDTLELNGNYFLGHSDYNIMMTYILGFNKELLDQYGGALEKSIYDMVREGDWTLNTLMELSKLVAIDVTGNGKSDDDYFGFTAAPFIKFNGFLTSCDIPMVAQTESGAYEVALTRSEYFAKADSLVEFFRELGNANYTHFIYPAGGGEPSVPLSSGRTLISVLDTINMENLLNYDLEFGVLPYPLYDKNQYDPESDTYGYKMLQWGGYLAVLSYMKDPVLTGETLEMLAYYSENVKITYYEKVLGKRVADMPDDAAMFDIIWNSLSTDMGQTFYNLGGDETGVCYVLPQLMNPEATQNLSSFLKKKESAINLGFKKFLDNID
ncbi:MAG: extracellular solute-binding protein [Clostridia bacterium]|nr:extracellular solute-binding protein [Clostridia bacterium]